MNTLQNLRVLLVQVRPDNVTRDHEFAQFLKQTGFLEKQVVRVDALNEVLSENVLEGIDAVVIGGSGDYLISQGDIPEVVEAIGELSRQTRKNRIPLLGICFGAQIMTTAFGGKVELLENKAETGTFMVTKNTQATSCPILSDLPNSFLAQLGHKDHLTKLPEGAVNLADSALSDVQIYTFPNEPVYAVVFHPELDREGIIYRLNYYAQQYHLSQEVLDELFSGLKSTPEASNVLRNFFTHVVLGKRYYPSTNQTPKSE